MVKKEFVFNLLQVEHLISPNRISRDHGCLTAGFDVIPRTESRSGVRTGFLRSIAPRSRTLLQKCHSNSLETRLYSGSPTTCTISCVHLLSCVSSVLDRRTEDQERLRWRWKAKTGSASRGGGDGDDGGDGSNVVAQELIQFLDTHVAQCSSGSATTGIPRKHTAPEARHVCAKEEQRSHRTYSANIYDPVLMGKA